MKSGTAVILGRPNSGKSTLLNALVGQRISIVSSRPQTTRHRILGIATEDRGQIVFVDTPGIHKPAYGMNKRMMRTVYGELKTVDLALVVVDASISFGSGENFVLETIKKARLRAMLLLNKIDRIAKARLLPTMRHYGAAYDFLEIIPISARTGENIDLLRSKIFGCLPDGEPLYDSDFVTDRTERFLAAEFIREKLLERVRQELPYACAVLIRKFDESGREKKNRVTIEADILVEKKSQQGIVLGSGASNLRDVGIAAREELEKQLGCKVHLGLQVRTARNWRNDDRILDQLELGA
ncbi:MAG: GTPase Era [Acidobacteria bacterium]|nr:GTPase Era [Acidobacteriota bacterium]